MVIFRRIVSSLLFLSLLLFCPAPVSGMSCAQVFCEYVAEHVAILAGSRLRYAIERQRVSDFCRQLEAMHASRADSQASKESLELLVNSYTAQPIFEQQQTGDTYLSQSIENAQNTNNQVVVTVAPQNTINLVQNTQPVAPSSTVQAHPTTTQPLFTDPARVSQPLSPANQYVPADSTPVPPSSIPAMYTNPNANPYCSSSSDYGPHWKERQQARWIQKQAQVLPFVNEERMRLGLRPLTLEQYLDEIEVAHSEREETARAERQEQLAIVHRNRCEVAAKMYEELVGSAWEPKWMRNGSTRARQISNHVEHDSLYTIFYNHPYLLDHDLLFKAVEKSNTLQAIRAQRAFAGIFGDSLRDQYGNFKGLLTHRDQRNAGILIARHLSEKLGSYPAQKLLKSSTNPHLQYGLRAATGKLTRMERLSDYFSNFGRSHSGLKPAYTAFNDDLDRMVFWASAVKKDQFKPGNFADACLKKYNAQVVESLKRDDGSTAQLNRQYWMLQKIYLDAQTAYREKYRPLLIPDAQKEAVCLEKPIEQQSIVQPIPIEQPIVVEQPIIMEQPAVDLPNEIISEQEIAKTENSDVYSTLLKQCADIETTDPIIACQVEKAVDLIHKAQQFSGDERGNAFLGRASKIIEQLPADRNEYGFPLCFMADPLWSQVEVLLYSKPVSAKYAQEVQELHDCLAVRYEMVKDLLRQCDFTFTTAPKDLIRMAYALSEQKSETWVSFIETECAKDAGFETIRHHLYHPCGLLYVGRSQYPEQIAQLMQDMPATLLLAEYTPERLLLNQFSEQWSVEQRRTTILAGMDAIKQAAIVTDLQLRSLIFAHASNIYHAAFEKGDSRVLLFTCVKPETITQQALPLYHDALAVMSEAGTHIRAIENIPVPISDEIQSQFTYWTMIMHNASTAIFDLEAGNLTGAKEKLETGIGCTIEQWQKSLAQEVKAVKTYAWLVDHVKKNQNVYAALTAGVIMERRSLFSSWRRPVAQQAALAAVPEQLAVAEENQPQPPQEVIPQPPAEEPPPPAPKKPDEKERGESKERIKHTDSEWESLKNNRELQERGFTTEKLKKLIELIEQGKIPDLKEQLKTFLEAAKRPEAISHAKGKWYELNKILELVQKGAEVTEIEGVRIDRIAGKTEFDIITRCRRFIECKSIKWDFLSPANLQKKIFDLYSQAITKAKIARFC